MKNEQSNIGGNDPKRVPDMLEPADVRDDSYGTVPLKSKTVPFKRPSLIDRDVKTILLYYAGGFVVFFLIIFIWKLLS